MPLVFMAIKAMKRRAIKASARKPITNKLLQADFSAVWGIGDSGLAAMPFTVNLAPNVMRKELGMVPPSGLAEQPSESVGVAVAEPARKRQRAVAAPQTVTYTPPPQSQPPTMPHSDKPVIGKGGGKSSKGRRARNAQAIETLE